MKFRTALFVFITPVLSVGLFAQNATKVEIFGGYSYFGLGSTTSATTFGLDRANLNGWNAAAKFNVTPRIGVVADFSGHYGDRAVRLPVESNPALQPKPGNMRQHSFLFGPEVRLLTNRRVAVNVRALAEGVVPLKPMSGSPPGSCSRS